MGKLVLVGSQKCDLGKTIICIKLGVALSESGKKVLLIDLSNGKKKMSEYLNVNEDIIYDIKDVLDGTCSLDQAIIEINNNLSILPSPRIADKLDNIKINTFTNLINNSISEYDFIIADVDKISLSYIDFKLVNEAITINNNDFSCIKEFNSDKTIAEKNNVNITAILNKYNLKHAKKGIMMNAKDIHKMTEMSMSLQIDENSNYENVDYDFLVSKDENSFNKVIKALMEKLI